MVPENIRIKFRKTGRLKYISHLDLCRTVGTSMIRAQIPIWYSEGFNPRPKMVFSQPLPLFVTGECEFLDIKITQEMTNEELIKRLRSVFTDELYIIDVYRPSRKFSDIGYAEYKITGFDFTDGEKIAELLKGEIKVIKQSKKGEKEVDISKMIKSVEYENGNLKAVLEASQESYLNPELLCTAFDTYLKPEDINVVHDITRVRWFDKNMEIFE